jgi:transcriptional regulator with XRE-family HTH domain
MLINALQKARAEKGLTLKGLADKAKVNASTISLLEQGHHKATLRTLGKLATALEIALDDLLELWDSKAAERGQLREAKKEGQRPELHPALA